VHVDVDINESVPPLVQDVAVAEHLLAIAGEASSNAIRHGQAHSVAIRLSCTSGRVVLTVADDGRGFGTHAQLAVTGRGLENMSQRAALLGARLRVSRGANGGTQVRVELPPRGGPCWQDEHPT
jgi:two-component system sensor histidine kinase UhpB